MQVEILDPSSWRPEMATGFDAVVLDREFPADLSLDSGRFFFFGRSPFEVGGEPVPVPAPAPSVPRRAGRFPRPAGCRPACPVCGRRGGISAWPWPAAGSPPGCRRRRPRRLRRRCRLSPLPVRPMRQRPAWSHGRAGAVRQRSRLPAAGRAAVRPVRAGRRRPAPPPPLKVPAAPGSRFFPRPPHSGGHFSTRPRSWPCAPVDPCVRCCSVPRRSWCFLG